MVRPEEVELELLETRVLKRRVSRKNERSLCFGFRSSAFKNTFGFTSAILKSQQHQRFLNKFNDLRRGFNFECNEFPSGKSRLFARISGPNLKKELVKHKGYR